MRSVCEQSVGALKGERAKATADLKGKLELNKGAALPAPRLNV
jgi:hypothetical protein